MKNLRLLILLLFLLFLLTLFSIAQSTSGTNSPALVLTHVTIIDATGAPPQPEMSVIISAGRIAAIGKSSIVAVPQGATVVDAAGKFLIPGLWDMHVHPGGREYLKLFIANGVTGIRVMWGSPEDYESRKNIEAGDLLGPRMVIASPLVDGPKPYWPGSISVSTTAEARQVVDKAKMSGADFVKVFPCSAVGGQNYIRALKAPFPDVRFIASGGVNRQTAGDFIRAGASALGIREGLIPAKAILGRELDLRTASSPS